MPGIEEIYKSSLPKAIFLIFVVTCLLFSSVSANSFGLLPARPEIKITSHKTGDLIQAGNLTISGTSNDNSTTDCQVFVDWNDLKPFQKAIAAGPNGTNDYSNWNFTYSSSYHLVTNGSNKITSKLSCIDEDEYLGKWFILNLTGIDQRSENKSQFLESMQKENLTDSYQRVIFSSLKINVPTNSEAKTLIKDKKIESKTSSEALKKFLLEYVKSYSKLQKNKLSPQLEELSRLLPIVLKENPTSSQKIQLEGILPNLIGSLLRDQEAGQKEANPLISIAKSFLAPSDWNMYVGAFNLGGTLGAQAQAGQLNFGDLLLAIGSVYLSVNVGGIVAPDVIYGIAKAVIPVAINLLSGLGKSEIPIQEVGYAIPTDPCESDTSIPQCDPNLIPIPFEDCIVGNESMCSDLDPIRAIGFCDDSNFNCIATDSYVPPLPGSDGYYYYSSCDFNNTGCDSVGEGMVGSFVPDESQGVSPGDTLSTSEQPPVQDEGIVPPGDTLSSSEQPPVQDDGIAPPGDESSLLLPETESRPEETQQNEEETSESASQQEDDGNYCSSDDDKCDGIPDDSEPAWCSDLQGGCENFTVCNEQDCNYDRDLLSEGDAQQGEVQDEQTVEEGNIENGSPEEEQIGN